MIENNDICRKINSSDDDVEIVKILAPLTDNPNAPCSFGYTPISWAARNGHTEIVKILTAMTQQKLSKY